MREYPAKGIHTNTQNTASWKRRKRTRSRIIHESHSHSNIFIYIYFNIMYTMFLAFAISPQNVRRRWPPLLFRALNLHLLLLPLILNRVLSVSVLPPPPFFPLAASCPEPSATTSINISVWLQNGLVVSHHILDTHTHKHIYSVYSYMRSMLLLQQHKF